MTTVWLQEIFRKLDRVPAKGVLFKLLRLNGRRNTREKCLQETKERKPSKSSIDFKMCRHRTAVQLQLRIQVNPFVCDKFQNYCSKLTSGVVKVNSMFY